MSTRASIATDVNVRTLDLSENRLTRVRADLLRALYPSLRSLLLHDNLITSLPVALVDGSLASLTLAGNPLRCDCAQPWLSRANVDRLSALVADWSDARCTDGRPLSRFAAADYHCAVPTGSRWRHPATVWLIAVMLGCVLVLATGLTLVGLVVRLVSWATTERRRRAQIYDVISVDGGRTGNGIRSTTVVLVVYCDADDDWIRSRLMPLLRQATSPLNAAVHLSLKTIDTSKRLTGNRHLLNSLKRSLAGCHLAIVVVSPNLVDELSRHDDVISGSVSQKNRRRRGATVF